MIVPNPKTAAELLALDEIEDVETVILRTPEDVEKYQKLDYPVYRKLKIGMTVMIRKTPEFWPNPTDPDTVFAARDANGVLWVQQGPYKRRMFQA